MRFLTGSILLFLISGTLVAGLAGTLFAGPDEPVPTSADVLDRARSLRYVVDRLLAGPGGDGHRTLLLLVDPAPALVQARFADVLEEGLSRLQDDDLAIGLTLLGQKGPLVVPPTGDRTRLLAALRDAMRSPRNVVHDVMSDVKAAALRIRGAPGRREIALVSLENGDGEKDLEATAALLRRSGTVLHVVGRSAFVADTYWVGRTAGAPPGLDMRGQESAYDDLPWGWVLQWATANQSVPSGFGFFGLSRLVQASGGRYYLYYPPTLGGSRCSPAGCRLCAFDHADCGTAYAMHRLRDIAPVLVPRVEVRRALARDPLFVELMRVWLAASGEGLLHSRPPLRPGPGLLREERRRTGTHASWYSSNSFGSVSRKAGKLAVVCGVLAKDLEDRIASTEPDRTTKRTVALAETTRTYLLVTRLNLRLLQEFCRRAPGLLSQPRANLAPGEVPLFDPARFDYRGIGFTNQCFCHGTKALERLEIPGLAQIGAEKEEAYRAVERLRAKYEGTPYGRTARIMGIAIFHLLVPGKPGKYVRPIPGMDDDDTGTGGTSRPPRGGSSGGSGTGTTTGGD